jgi:hypothetical protein
MPEKNPEQLLEGAVNAVLESMFFAESLGPAEPETGGGVLEASLAFHGRPSGTLGVRLSVASARLLAAGFLGEDETDLTDSQPGEVLCELANMLCGSFVSSFERDEVFSLARPELVPAPQDCSVDSDVVNLTRRSFQLENGVLTVTVLLEAAT